MPQTATNPQTGEKVIWTGNEWKPYDEEDFQRWYGQLSHEVGINDNPDDPQHQYDYRAAYAADAGPLDDPSGHWPPEFKSPTHPNRYVNGIDTISGKKAKTATNPETGEKVYFHEGFNRWEPFTPEVEAAPAGVGRIIKKAGRSALAGVGSTLKGLAVSQQLDEKERDKFKDIRAAGVIAPGGYLETKAIEAVKKLSGADIFQMPEKYAKPSGSGKIYQLLEDATSGMAAFGPSMALTAVNAPAGAASMYFQILGDEFTSREGRTDDNRNLLASSLSAAVQTPIELVGTLFELKALSRILSGKASRFIWSLTQTAGAEGTEEYLQKFPSLAADIYTDNPDLSADELAGEFWKHVKSPEFQKQAGYEALAGATGGLLFGLGGKVAAQGLRFADYKSQKQKDIDAAKQKDLLKPEAKKPEVEIQPLFAPHTAAEGAAMQAEIKAQQRKEVQPEAQEVDLITAARQKRQAKIDQIAEQEHQVTMGRTGLVVPEIRGREVDVEQQQREIAQRQQLTRPAKEFVPPLFEPHTEAEGVAMRAAITRQRGGGPLAVPGPGYDIDAERAKKLAADRAFFEREARRLGLEEPAGLQIAPRETKEVKSARGIREDERQVLPTEAGIMEPAASQRPDVEAAKRQPVRPGAEQGRRDLQLPEQEKPGGQKPLTKKDRSLRAYNKYVDSLTDEQRQTAADLIEEKPASPSLKMKAIKERLAEKPSERSEKQIAEENVKKASKYNIKVDAIGEEGTTLPEGHVQYTVHDESSSIHKWTMQSKNTVEAIKTRIAEAEKQRADALAKEKPPAEEPKAKKPKKKGAAPLAIEDVKNLGGAIRKLKNGGINLGAMKGEAKEFPVAWKYLFKNSGESLDIAEPILRDAGFLGTNENILDLARDANNLKRSRLTADILEKKGYELPEAERRVKEEIEHEEEVPPTGEYVTMEAEDLPEGKKLTLIEGESRRGWDVYEIQEKDPFGITLKDGVTIELKPGDKVQVLKKDLGEAKKTDEPDEKIDVADIVKNTKSRYRIEYALYNNYLDSERKETDGAWDRSTVSNYAKTFIRPLAKQIAKKDWQTSAELRDATGAYKRAGANIAKDLKKLVAIGDVQIAWDKEGMPHYALSGVERGDLMTEAEIDKFVADQEAKQPAEKSFRRGSELANAMSNISGISKAHLQKYPSGKWGYVGSVDARLMFVKKDGSELTKEDLDYISKAQSRAMAMNIRGVKSLAWDTREDAIKAAQELGITVYENNKPIEPGKPTLELKGEKAMPPKQAELSAKRRTQSAGRQESLGLREKAPKGDWFKGEKAGKKEAAAFEKKTGKLEDFGEKIGGARKDISTFATKELSDDDIGKQTLTQIWPKSQIDSIEDNDLAAIATAIRAEIPTKPQKSYKLKRWIEQVKQVRELMKFAEEMGPKSLLEKMKEQPGLSNLVAKIKVLQAIDRDNWGRIGRVHEAPNAYTFEGSKKVPSPFVDVRIDNINVSFKAKSVSEVLTDIQDRIQKSEPQKKKMKFEVRGRTGKYQINKVGDPLYRPLKTFTDLEEARKYRIGNYDALVLAWEQLKERENVKETDVRSKENRPRVGFDHRKGKDATPEMFTNAFGFRGVEFGNWVSQGKNIKERQGMLNAAYDALHDLADIMGIPAKAISLNGELGLGLGSRGHGGASAHYEPGYIVINLTKTRGAGAIAHEFFHAMDHYFHRVRGGGTNVPHGTYITYQPETYYEHKNGQKLSATRYREIEGRGGLNPSEWKKLDGKIRPEVSEAFKDLVDAINKSPMSKRASLIDKGKSGGYWSRIIERAARSFENYVIAKMQQKGYYNDYLANVVNIEKFQRDPGRYPYLLADELPPIESAFDNLFATIKTKQTDKGIALFSLEKGQYAPAVKKRYKRGAIPQSISQQRLDESFEELGWGRVATIIPAKTKLQKMVVKIAGQFGIKIRYFDWHPEGFTVGGLVIPDHPDTIYLNSQNKRPLLAVVAHELIHTLEHNHPDLHLFFLNALSKNVGGLERYLRELNYTRNLAKLPALTKKEVFNEFASDFAGDSFVDPNFYEIMHDIDPRLAAQLVRILKKIFNKVKNILTSGAARPYSTNEYVNNISEVQKALASVLSEYAKRRMDPIAPIRPVHFIPNFMVAAWHGSPYKFEKFATSKIGTGEGAQAFGWGLYFSDLKDVAATYATMDLRRGLVFDGKYYDKSGFVDAAKEKYGEDYALTAEMVAYDFISGYNASDIIQMTAKRGDVEKAVIKDMVEGLERPSADANRWTVRVKGGIRVENQMTDEERRGLFDIQGRAGWYSKPVDPLAKTRKMLEQTVAVQTEKINRADSPAEVSEAKSWLKDAKIALAVMDKYELVAEWPESRRNLYKAILHPGRQDEVWLDWDKKIPFAVYKKVINRARVDDDKIRAAGKALIPYGEKGPTGEDLYKDVAEHYRRHKSDNPKKEASLFLKRAGIDGIRYPAGSLSGMVDTGAKNYVIFDEEAVEIQERAQLTAAPQIAINPWYSQMQRVLEAKLPGKGTPASMLQAIKSFANKGEYKAEELEWSGLEDWLGEQEGKLTKQQVLDFVATNKVRIDEMVKADYYEPVFSYFSSVYGKRTKDPAKAEQWFSKGHPVSIESEDGNDQFLTATSENYSTFSEAKQDAVDVARDAEVRGTTKFSTYTLPGGEQYRELLLTLPVRDKITTALGQSLREIIDKSKDNYPESGFENPRMGRRSSIYADVKESGLFDSSGLRRFSDLLVRPKEKLLEQFNIENRIEEVVYKGGHWDEPNVLAHVRFDERTDAEGRRVLHIAEIQSDWHQEGRKKGYKKIPLRPDMELHVTWKDDPGYYEIRNKNGDFITSIMPRYANSLQDAEAIARERIDSGHIHRSGEGVPQAPFKKTWPMLAFKRMVRWAAENNFDAVTWDPGEIQAERYDLSKQVDEIAITKKGDRYDIDIVKDGTVLADIQPRNIPLSKVEEYVGKDLAQKAAKQKDGTVEYSGLDLKVGGEGMKAFYDKMLVNEVNKFFNKAAWGKAKVEVGKVGPIAPVSEYGGIERLEEGEYQEVWTLPITDQMRQKALYEGMPQFSLSGSGRWKKPYKKFREYAAKYPKATKRQIKKATGLTRYEIETLQSLEAQNVRRPAQLTIQAATGERGDLDDPTMAGRLWDEFVFQAQDRFNYLNKEQMAAERARRVAGQGEELPEGMDTYLAELRYHGIAGAAIDDFQERFVDPLIDTISQNGLDVKDVDQYLHARHAQEANVHLKEINQEIEDNDALSGMTDERAAEILEQVEQSGQAAAYREIARIVDDITKFDRENRVSYGLEKPETVAKWEAAYRYYVPLMREGKGSMMPVKGQGFSIKGAQKRRAGSQREVINVLAYTISQAEHAIVRGEKNKVSRALYDFVSENPGPWEADKVEYKAAFDAQGLVHYVPDPSYQVADNVVHLRINGDPHHVTFDRGNHNAVRIAQAMKKLKTGDSGPIVNIASKMTRWLAMVNTGLNPEFLISNFVRDLQTAGYNMSDSQAQQIKWAAIKQVGQAWNGIRQFQKGDRGGEWATWFNEFRKGGGQTGWLESYENIEKREKDLINKVKQMGPGGWRKFRRGLSAVFDFISDENTAVENGIRLSVYKNLRENNVTKAKAARIAKELTVNFNRKGNAGQALNAAYLFYNASIQGSARVISAAIKSAKVRKLILSTVIFATALDVINRLVGGDDDDGTPRYDKVPDWVKERNLIVMLPSGYGYLKIPLPWGYNVFHVLGQGLGEVMTKKNNTVGKSAARVGAAVVQAFNPIGGETSILQFLSPTIFRPIVQWAENKDWTGRPLRPNDNPFSPMPESSKYFKSVRDPSRVFAEKLNELTGGSDIRPGKIDINPEAIDLFIDTFVGGAGRFAGDMISAPLKVAKGETIETYEIPLLRKVYGASGFSQLHQDFYENIDAIRLTQNEIKHYQNDPDKLKEIKRKYGKEAKLIQAQKNATKLLKEYRDQKRRIESLKDSDKKTAKLKEIDEKTKKLMQSFNKKYYKVMGEEK